MKRFKRVLGLICVMLVLQTVLFSGQALAASPVSHYTDIPGEDHWAYDGINFVISEGLMVGSGNGKFSPKQAASRAMLATVLHRVAGSPEMGTAENFKDVPRNAWYKKAVDWAYLAGVVSGYSDTKFGPNDFLTREQAVTMLYSFAQAQGYSHMELSLSYDFDGVYDTYADFDQVSKWAVPAVKWSLNAGLLCGTRKEGALALDPKGIVTREQLATILYKFDHIVKWPGKGDAVGTENNRLTVTGLLASPSYIIDENDATLLKKLLTDERWSKSDDFLEYPATFAIYLADTEYLLYIKDGAWLEQCGFIATRENGEKVCGSMTVSDATVLQEIVGVCQHYTPE